MLPMISDALERNKAVYPKSEFFYGKSLTALDIIVCYSLNHLRRKGKGSGIEGCEILAEQFPNAAAYFENIYNSRPAMREALGNLDDEVK